MIIKKITTLFKWLCFTNPKSRRDTVITKSHLAFSLSIIFLILIAFPEGLQAGNMYECRDKNGKTIYSNTLLDNGYKCISIFSYRDITDEERRAWEIESEEKKRALLIREAEEKKKREIEQWSEQKRKLNEEQKRKEEQRLKEHNDMLKREEERRIKEEERREREEERRINEEERLKREEWRRIREEERRETELEIQKEIFRQKKMKRP